jgi:hypothetical protein
MSDRELLEAAAKAAGISIDKSETNGGGRGNTGFDGVGNAVLDWHNGRKWNPLTDDGDALRLAVKLKIRIDYAQDYVRCWLEKTGWIGETCLPCDTEHLGTAHRRAIVRAAASLAQTLPKTGEKL